MNDFFMASIVDVSIKKLVIMNLISNLFLSLDKLFLLYIDQILAVFGSTQKVQLKFESKSGPLKFKLCRQLTNFLNVPFSPIGGLFSPMQLECFT
jgi:hypothetical protein